MPGAEGRLQPHEPVEELVIDVPNESSGKVMELVGGRKAEVKKMESIILSMTPRERAHPEIVDGSRRRRIARGSGTQVSDVNRQLSQVSDTLAANKGEPTAQNNLGVLYANGTGVPKDLAEGVKWYRKAADQGSALAETNLAGLYSSGHGVTQSDGDAAALYRQAAEQGYPPAQYFLGVHYAEGKGVPRDYAQAYFWLNLAAAYAPPGDVRDSAASNRDAVLARLTPEQLMEQQKAAREWKPKTP